MKRITRIAIPFALILAFSASGPTALAQGMPGTMDAGCTTGPGYEVTAEMQRYREMNDPEIGKQTGEMRKQMDTMMRAQP
jgi:hypothetical protein